MANKVSLDQTTAWILSIVTSVAVFSGGYALLKQMTKGRLEAGNHFDVQAMEDPDGAHGGSGASDHGEHGHAATAEDHHGGIDSGTPGHESKDEKPHGDKHHEVPEHEQPDHDSQDSHRSDKHADAAEKHADAAEKHTDTSHDVHWTYEGENGPDMWGKLSPNFVDCQDGRSQSPVNFENTKSQRDLRPLKFSYLSSETKLENNGHTIGPKFDTGNYLTFSGERYGLVGFHFHIPSEHQVGGVPYEMELHLVHKNKDGNLAVVGLFVEEGEHSNALLEKISTELPSKAGASSPAMMIDPKDFLPEDTSYYAYKGSLTTPPCSEGVQLLVVKKSIKASAKQIAMFAQIYHRNARPTQPLYGRSIIKSEGR